MLDSFWTSLEIDSASDLGYIDDIPYGSIEQKDEVIEKLDWVILKLHKIKDKNSYDYKLITMMRNNIKINNCSLNSRGVDYLNSVIKDLKTDIF